LSKRAATDKPLNTVKGKEGYDALTMMKGDGVVSKHSMADCFIEFIQTDPERLTK
jgi:5'-nucleotidase